MRFLLCFAIVVAAHAGLAMGTTVVMVGGAIDTGFDAGLNSGNVVHSIARDAGSGELLFAGSLGVVSSKHRVLARWNGSSLGAEVFGNRTSGTPIAFAVTIVNNNVVIGGNFTQVWNGTDWSTRSGLAAASLAGALNGSWQHNLLQPSSDELVCALMVDGNDLWVGGDYTSGTPRDFGVYPTP